MGLTATSDATPIAAAAGGQHTSIVPRWRLAGVRAGNVQRTALAVARQLREPGLDLPLWGLPRYHAYAPTADVRRVFVAAGTRPVGVAIDALDALSNISTAWLNPADLPLLRRGYLPLLLLLAKRAAAVAFGHPIRLGSLTVTPLPHRPGELLIRASSGWAARARVWPQAGHLLALAWQD